MQARRWRALRPERRARLVNRARIGGTGTRDKGRHPALRHSPPLRQLAAGRSRGQPGGPRTRLVGPPVVIAARAAQPLCMALHELATNAVKYGALSVPGGLLTVTWRVEPGRMLHLAWRESGVPGLAAPSEHRGVGSRVIEQTVQS